MRVFELQRIVYQKALREATGNAPAARVPVAPVPSGFCRASAVPPAFLPPVTPLPIRFPPAFQCPRALSGLYPWFRICITDTSNKTRIRYHASLPCNPASSRKNSS